MTSSTYDTTLPARRRAWTRPLTPRALARSLHAGRRRSVAHCCEVARLARAIADELGLDRTARANVELGALLHDVGKMAVPAEILAQPRPLTDDEWAIVRRHPSEGAEMVAGLYGRPAVAAIVRNHHERWDGRGYPDGVQAGHIPLGARIVAVADAFVAMTETRPYRAARSTVRALQQLEEHAGTQFDPDCVRALRAILA